MELASLPLTVSVSPTKRIMTTSPQKVLTAFIIVLCSATLGFGAEANLLNDGGFEQPIAGPRGLNSGYLACGSGSTIGGA
jgi:hypothetical protein